METAPFRSDLAAAPDGAKVVWRTTDDGIRLRLAAWSTDTSRGTILIFPGRTEYIEKYGRVITDFTHAGWSVAIIDWRGQGFSDRLYRDERLGHVREFVDYQRDVAALNAWIDEIELPQPRVLLAHSMGGCIGLRSLVRGLDVSRVVFSAPMWGIQMPALARPLTYFVPSLARIFRQETQFAPGTTPTNYVCEADFDTNMLTSDKETYLWLAEHAQTVPEFALGGPSIQWVGSALQELRRLLSTKKPSVSCLTFIGSHEQIVSAEAIEDYHRAWEPGELRHVDGAKHEMMMETPHIRGRFMRESLEFFNMA